MGQLAAIIDQLAASKIDTGVAAARIRRMKGLPPVPQPTSLARLGADDPSGTPVDDDGHELSEARSDGKITPEQYKVLYDAWCDARSGTGASAR